MDPLQESMRKAAQSSRPSDILNALADAFVVCDGRHPNVNRSQDYGDLADRLHALALEFSHISIEDVQAMPLHRR